MSYTVKEIKVPGTDNIHTLSGILYIPEGEIKGILHIVHGMCEYIGRYKYIMSAAAEKGYVCCGYDNLGHGKTAADESELGFIAHKDGWKYLVNDVNAFITAVKAMFPDKKVYLMGHSMGSFIARIAAENYGGSIEKLIICGTGGPNPAAPFGLLLTDIIRLFYGEKHISKLANNLVSGAFNKHFEGTTKYDWIAADRETVKNYAKDKYCTFEFTVSAMHDLVKLNATANRKNWFGSLRKDLPIFIISGSDDPVGSFKKGVSAVYNRLKAAGIQDVSLKFYDGYRHEILNEACKDEVISDILRFIEKQ